MSNVAVPVAVKAYGMVTSVGFNAPASLAAMRAGISGVRESALWDSESGQHIPAAKVDLPHWWIGLGKIVDLVSPAINECLSAALPVTLNEIPILLCNPSPNRPFRIQGLDDQLLSDVEYKLSIPHHPESMIIPKGRSSVVYGIKQAIRLISEQKVKYCILAAADSFLGQDIVDHHILSRRINTESNSNGFLPGEAGSAILLGKAEYKSKSELDILGTGIAMETATIDSENPLRGEGIINAVGQALSIADKSYHDMFYRITDLNGEHYKFKEAMLVALRYEREARPYLRELWHPAEYIGEVGAAIGPIALALAFHASENHYAPGELALCHFSSDEGNRSAVVLQFRKGEKRNEW